MNELIVWLSYSFLFLCSSQRADLIQTLWLAHSALNVKSSHILPVLLQEGNQKIDCKVNICNQLVVGHLNMTDSHSKAQNLRTKTTLSHAWLQKDIHFYNLVPTVFHLPTPEVEIWKTLETRLVF